MSTASKQQHGGGTRGNRQFNKPDFVSPHKKSKLDLQDERTTKIEIRVTHERRGVFTKTIELYQLENETKRWEKDNYIVSVNN